MCVLQCVGGWVCCNVRGCAVVQQMVYVGVMCIVGCVVRVVAAYIVSHSCAGGDGRACMHAYVLVWECG